jgi:uncharacterized membrane protein YjfL (UPF0719 family)
MSNIVSALVISALLGLSVMLAHAAMQPRTLLDLCRVDPVACVILLNEAAPPPDPGQMV